MSGVGILFSHWGMTTMVYLLSSNCSETICVTIQMTYSSSFALTHFSGGAKWHWLMSTSDLKSFLITKKIKHLLMKVFTILCISPASTLMVIVKKKNGKLRVCVDYWKLNACTQKDHFLLPFITLLLEEIGGHVRYTIMDGYVGYNQIAIALCDVHKTAFTSPWGPSCGW